MKKKAGKAKAASPKVSPHAAGKAVVAVSGLLTKISKTSAKKTAQNLPSTKVGNLRSGSAAAGAALTASASVSAAASQAQKGKLVCAGPYKMTDSESAGDRKASGEFVLEIVPTTSNEGDIICVKSTGKCSCAGALVKIGEKNYTINTPAKVDGWSVVPDGVEVDVPGVPVDMFKLITVLGSMTPKSEPVQVICGRDKSVIQSGEIQIYPSNQIEIDVDLQEFVKKWPPANDIINDLAGVLSTITGKKVDPYKGINFQVPGGLGLVSVDPPTLSFTYEAQWKEYAAGSVEEWRTYYYWKASLSLALSAEFDLDVLTVAADLTGVGASIIALVHQALEAIGQDKPLIYLGFNGEISGTGSLGYEEKVFGSLELKGTGTVSLGGDIDADVVEISIEASTSVDSSLTGKASNTGLEVTYELLKWEGVEGKAHIKLNCGWFGSVGLDKSMQIIGEAGPLIKGQLFP